MVAAIHLGFYLNRIDLAFSDSRRWRWFMLGHAAELLIVNEFGNRGMRAAHGAIRILAQLQLAEAHRKCVVEQQAADQRLANSQNQFHRFGGLDQADHARQNSQHAAFGATRNQARGWRFGVQAAIARPARIREHAGLAFEAKN